VSGGGSRRVDAAGVRLHVAIEGSGPDVLLLHGFTGSGRGMAGVAAGLRDAWRTLRLDLPGHGRSEAPHAVAAYAMPSCVAQVVAALDALGARRPHLVGYSMGGRVALALAAAAPERFASATLIGASAGIADPRERAARRSADEALARRIESEGIAAFVGHWMSLPLLASQRRRLAPAQLAEARAERLANAPHGLANSLRGMGAGAQPPLHARLPDVDLPVLLAVGSEDAKFRAIAGDLAGRLPDARIVEVPDAGHAAHLENPRFVVAAVRAFLAHGQAGRRPHSAIQTPDPMEAR
jgi:2-succinyl-6-hydroxy-2,4-cyclohexadiene-1-carboxylate synthase